MNDSVGLLFDSEALLERSDRDAEFARDIIALFYESTGESLRRIEAATDDLDDPGALHALAHDLKGAALGVSALAVAACAARLEQPLDEVSRRSALRELHATLEATVVEWRRTGWLPTPSASV